MTVKLDITNVSPKRQEDDHMWESFSASSFAQLEVPSSESTFSANDITLPITSRMTSIAPRRL